MVSMPQESALPDTAANPQPCPILQSVLPAVVAELAARRLPGMAPVDPEAWLIRDEAFAEQMALRDRLLQTHRGLVLRERAGGSVAAAELLEAVLAHCLEGGYGRRGDVLTRPDGVDIDLHFDTPLATAARLVQEDLLILEPGPSGHVLVEGALLFPASWTLAEKISRPLTAIHGPVAAYDPDLARRVQRMFDAIRPGQPLVRANRLEYADFRLFQPRREADPPPRDPVPRYIRSERQSLRRLPETGAIVFSIHTYVVENRTTRGL